MSVLGRACRWQRASVAHRRSKEGGTRHPPFSLVQGPQLVGEQMSEESSDKAEPMERQLYLEHRKTLVELGVAQIGLFDKTLILLSTGALGASALFVDTFVGEGAMHLQPILALSWLAFALTMLANLSSYWTSWKDMEVEREAWDEKYSSGYAGIPHANVWKTVTSSLNICAFLLFMFGLCGLLVFCFNNLGGKP